MASPTTVQLSSFWQGTIALLGEGRKSGLEARLVLGRLARALVATLCSLLSARLVSPEGGATEFASTRCDYPSLPDSLKRQAETAVAVHHFFWSRDQIRPGFWRLMLAGPALRARYERAME